MTSDIKLVLAVDALSPTLTGIGRYTWELANRMQHQKSIARTRYYRNGTWIKNPASLLVEVFQPPRRLKVARRIQSLCTEHYCKQYIFHGPNFFLPAFAENGVVTVHDLSIFKYPETHPTERVKHFEKSFLQTLGIAKHLITPSETIRQEVIDYFGWPSHRITSVYNGVPSTYYPRSSNELEEILLRYGLTPKNYTLCVSTIEPRKRIEQLIMAYARLPKALLLRYPLVLVGDKGWNSDSQHEKIEAAQQAGWLQYLGFVKETDLPKIYAGARLFVYPSIYEGFGLPIAEAMACGVPVITSNRSCLPEITAGAARLIDPDDLEMFTENLEACLIDCVWRDVAVAQGIEVAKQYTWENCVQKTVDVYKKINI